MADVDSDPALAVAAGVLLLQFGLLVLLISPTRMSGSRLSALALCGGLFVVSWFVIPGIGHNIYFMFIPIVAASVVVFSAIFLYYRNTRL
jgi:integral membrane sensor domain MASE1